MGLTKSLFQLPTSTVASPSSSVTLHSDGLDGLDTHNAFPSDNLVGQSESTIDMSPDHELNNWEPDERPGKRRRVSGIL